MLKFLISRRWISFILFVIIMAVLCVRLSMWQFDRLDERHETNAIVTKNLDSSPVPLTKVTEPGATLPKSAEWKPVQVSGVYQPEQQLQVKYQTRERAPGVEIVTPLQLSNGTVVMVNRGWMDSPNTSKPVTDVPPPPSGEVTVTGWLRLNSTADGQAIRPVQGQVRAISTDGLAEFISAPLFPGYIDVKQQTPEGANGLLERPAPDLGDGPHFFYALQWIFFGGLALFGLGYFAWAELKDRRQRTADHAKETSSA